MHRNRRNSNLRYRAPKIGGKRSCTPSSWTRNFVAKYQSGQNVMSGGCPPPSHMTPDGCLPITVILL